MSDFRKTVTNAVIDMFEAGRAEGRSSYLETGVADHSPYNPNSDNHFRGANALWLTLVANQRGWSDDRWMTYDQARRLGAFVREGERGTQIEYWDWMARLPVLDDNGDPKKDRDGNVVTASILRDQPRVFYATVFNAGQIDGLDPAKDRGPSFDPVEKAKELVTQSGPKIIEKKWKGKGKGKDGERNTSYDTVKDTITVPEGLFSSERSQYAALLHQVAYAAMHESRLNMPEGRELRAEIVSINLASKLGIGPNLEFHTDHTEKICESLREDHNEIFRAARDADQVATWIMHPARRQELERRAAIKAEAAARAKEAEIPRENRHFITVPYPEKDEARAVGARWDRTEKSWYVAKDSDLSKVKQWDIPRQVEAENAVSPVKEFGEFCRSHGLKIDGDPVMDGRWHRVAVEGDDEGRTAGSYKGYLDGKPNGLVHNFRNSDAAVKWVATGISLDAKASEELKKQWDDRSKQRSADLKQQKEQAAKKAYVLWSNAPWASPDHCPYLKKKGVGSYGVKQFDDGTVVIPARDIDGRIQTLQFVTKESKKFLTGGSKKGCHHTIDPEQTLGRGPVIIAEGYATAATIHEATGRPVVVAFDSGNLLPVAASLRGRYPSAEIVVAADNDHQLPAQGKANVGIEKATEAAERVDGHVLAPEIPDELKTKGATDFDDIRNHAGIEAVKTQIEGGLDAIRSKSMEAGRGMSI